MLSSSTMAYSSESSEELDVECSSYKNITFLEEARAETYSDGQVAFVTVFLPVLMMIGILTNSAFIYVVVRVPRMRTVTNSYLVVLAVADIMFLMFAIGSKIWQYSYSPLYADDSTLGFGGCLLTQFIINMTYFVTLCSITLVSRERYNGVCRPHRKRDTRLRVLAFMVISVFGSALLSASLLLSFTKTIVVCTAWPDVYPYSEWPTKRYFFYSMDTWVDYYSHGIQTVPFFISLVVNAIFYHRIIHGLNKSISRSHNTNHRASIRDSSTRDQIARMLVINGIALFALLAPFEILSFFQLVAMLRDASILSREVKVCLVMVARVASYSNAVVNPVIYTALSSRYRESFQTVFVPQRCRTSPRAQRIENSAHGSTVTVQCGVTSRAHESRM